MEKYQVKLFPQAFRDIEEIFEYIAYEKLSPEISKGQTDRIKHALKSLEFMPQHHQDRTVGYFADKGYKQLLIDNYLAIFRIDEEQKIVYVLTVQYQGRDL